MGFSQAITTCFRKYFTFSGRATSSEYWWFVLFIVLASVIAGLVDNLLFGSGTVSAESNGTSVSVNLQSDGPIASIFTLAVLVPSLSAGWRRMHDTGRSGLFLLYPLIVMVGLTTFMGFMEGFGNMMSGQMLEAMTGAGGLVAGLAMIVLIISPLLVLWWLTRRSQPGPNQYGPNPHEVTQ